MIRSLKSKLDNLIAKITSPTRYSANDCKNVSELRAYAQSVIRSDPGFAQDLFAACNRAEAEA